MNVDGDLGRLKLASRAPWTPWQLQNPDVHQHSSLLMGEEETHRISWTAAASSLTASSHVHSYAAQPHRPQGGLTFPPPSGLEGPDPSLLRLQRSRVHHSSLTASLNELSTGFNLC